jgi:hypothetical protein
MPTIGEQAVGDIQRRCGLATQQCAKGELRHWRPVVGQQRLGLRSRRLALTEYQRQCAGGIAQRTADTQQVARPRAAAAQGLAGRHATEHGHGDAQRAAGGVATNQAHAALGHAAQAVGIGRSQSGHRRQGQGKGKADCSGAHGGQVTDRHGQRALAEQQRIARVGNAHRPPGYRWKSPVAPRGKIQQGAVVADPQGHAFAALRTGAAAK